MPNSETCCPLSIVPESCRKGVGESSPYVRTPYTCQPGERGSTHGKGLTISLYEDELGTRVGSTEPKSSVTYSTSSSITPSLDSYSSSGPNASTHLYPGKSEDCDITENKQTAFDRESSKAKRQSVPSLAWGRTGRQTLTVGALSSALRSQRSCSLTTTTSLPTLSPLPISPEL